MAKTEGEQVLDTEFASLGEARLSGPEREADRTNHALSRGQPAVEETQHRTPRSLSSDRRQEYNARFANLPALFCRHLHYSVRVASRGPEHLFSSGGKVNGGPILAS